MMTFRRCYPFALLLLALSLLAADVTPTETPPPFMAECGTPGTAARQFSRPDGVAVDAQGNVYVADNENNRIQKFDSNGRFLRAWGWGVATGGLSFEICTSSCQSGQLGTGDGQFNAPCGVAVDAKGRVYVGDSTNFRIEKFGFPFPEIFVGEPEPPSSQ
jgi:DNA-binding beta-propeller fold protein YncE